MSIDDLNCPNCGAPVEFAGAALVTCAFCRSSLLLTGEGVRAAGAMSDLAREPSVQPSARAASPQVSAASMFSLARRKGLAGMLPMGCLLVIVSQVLFVCICGTFVALASNVLMRTWGPIDQVTTLVNQQPEVVRALGQPIKLGALTDSSFQSKNGITTIKFNAPLQGAIDSGKVHVEGRRADSVWSLDIRVTYPQDGVERQVFIQRRVAD
jgi:hypothetical protein